ncbi:uncharacterized protein N7484_010708 [Penicillium longicatenatum]|uniref:uncharacterized protein n=1 Tax=Penicillium longicatenatum TaxID=1561947 RepID=UPI002548032C|nr:uncharacterized protein N7484_010708 [Penicillium longicatenatum]KAJ5630608.1 hypothetical protein N7484_010708 [Penicillium longicatenatum]
MPTTRGHFRLAELPFLIWEFTENDFITFAIPNTGFGLLAAYVSPTLTTCTKSAGALAIVLRAAPLVLLWNWVNLIAFDVANQRLPESVKEDSINKPWRPLPQGRMSLSQARQLLLWTVPVALVLGIVLQAGWETALILLLTWMYNDLHGGDALTRDFIIAVAYDAFLAGSLRIALSAATGCTNVELSTTGYRWLGIIGGIILTTMQIQDLRDQAGDRTRGRQTWPLVLGDSFSRIWISACVVFWSIFCVLFWAVPYLVSAGVLSLGAWIGVSVMWKKEDVSAWKWWCLWQLVLYSLPVWSYCIGA